MFRQLPANPVIGVTAWDRSETADGIRFTHPNPNGKHSWDLNGFIESNDHAADVLDWYGLRLKVSGIATPTTMTVTFTCSLNRNPRPEALIDVSAPVELVPGEEAWLPIADLPLDEGMGVLPRGVIAVSFALPGGAELETADFVAARDLAVACDLRGKAIERGGEAVYTAELANLTDHALPVHIRVRRKGVEMLPVSLRAGEAGATGENADLPLSRVQSVTLAPDERRSLAIAVHDHPRLGPNGHEDQRIVFTTPAGEQELGLVTVRASDDFHTTIHRADIEAIKDKIANYEWARKAWGLRVAEADKWQVPRIDPKADHLFGTLNGEWAFNCSLVYLISGDERYARKVVEFLREFINPEYGYFVTPKGGDQELVHEGEFFRNTAAAFDHVLDAGLLTDGEIADIRRAFRVFEDIIRKECLKGKISNWNLAELAGVIAIAAERQDLEAVEEFLDMPGGLLDHVSRGIVDDGWWYEASIGYNFLAMGLFLLVSDMIDRYGYDVAHREVPASFADHYAIDEQYVDESDKIDGLTTDIWGPTDHPTRSVEMLVNSMTAFFDYDNMIFGMNDSCESKAPAHASPVNPRYDLAYAIYRDKSLLPLLHRVPEDQRDLYYGVADLPPVDAETPILSNANANAPVAGITMLRSQAPGRTPDQQYQVTVKTGILGGAHGHYDRLALNSIRRYGKSFYSPENIWHSYHTFMYKFFVQNSVTHNMTTVDLKQQDPAEARVLAFKGGEKLQLVVHELTTRWCNPPYGGWVVTPDVSYPEQAWLEGRKVPLPAEGVKAPAYARRSDFTEPVTQRRATIVTDDYILLVDWLEGKADHQYDFLFHCDGLQSIMPVDALGAPVSGGEARYLSDDPQDSDHFAIGAGMDYLGHEDALDPSPLSSGQFITDCHRMAVNPDARPAAVKVSFAADLHALNDLGWFVRQRTSGNAPGIMHMDVWSVEPDREETLVARDPEYVQTQQQLHWTVSADGTKKAEGKFGAWIFGRDDVSVDVTGAKELELETFSGSYFTKGIIEPTTFEPRKALFWGDGYVETSDGRRIALADLPRADENVAPVPVPNRDYEGGPVTIEMKRMATSLPASPVDLAEPARIRVDLSGIDAVSLHVSVGADYPIGNEKDFHRTLDFRKSGRTAGFVTLIEQHDGTPQVKAVHRDGDDVVVSLADGRTQRVTIADHTLADPTITLQED